MSLFRHASRRHQASHNAEVCDLQTHDSVTMEDFQCEVMRALWHPFDILDDGNTGKVQVSRLKVITSNIGLRLGHKKAEELLNKGEVTSMTFEDFFKVIKEELLDKLDDPPTEDENSNTPSLNIVGKATKPELLNGIIKTCWTFCSFERHYKVSGMTMEHCMVLWRLFNFLSECDENRTPFVPIKLHRDEVSLLLQKFIDHTGQRNKESVIKEFKESRGDEDVLTFTEFLNMFEKDIADSLSRNDITQGLNHLFDYYIMNVLAKETMWKRGYNVKNWKERWLVLTTTGLKYFVNNSEKVLKGEIDFDSECQVEVPQDRPTNRPNRFVIKTTKKPYEISAPDARTKNEWVSAIQTALKVVGENPNIQKEAAFQRNLERIHKKRLLEDEERKRLEEAERQRKQQEELDAERKKRLEDEELLKARQGELEEERRRRAEMEGRLTEEQRLRLEEQRLREEEQQRLRELERIKSELERLLEEERQAKKDEEIVRNLQARLLEEEFQKREELEKLKQKQEELLRAEREQKAVLEGDKKEQERILREARERLEQLERDRAAAAEKMQEASDKLLKAEKDRLIMEERVKLYKTKTSVGLRGTVQPHVEPLVTHRGQGAFCSRDFFRKYSTEENDVEPKNTNEKTKGDKQEDNFAEKEPEKLDSNISVDTITALSQMDTNQRKTALDIESNTANECAQKETEILVPQKIEPENANNANKLEDGDTDNDVLEITDSGYHDEENHKLVNVDKTDAGETDDKVESIETSTSSTCLAISTNECEVSNKQTDESEQKQNENTFTENLLHNDNIVNQQEKVTEGEANLTVLSAINGNKSTENTEEQSQVVDKDNFQMLLTDDEIREQSNLNLASNTDVPDKTTNETNEPVVEGLTKEMEQGDTKEINGVI